VGGWAALEPNAASLAAGGYRVQAAGARRHTVPLIQLLQGDLSTRAPGDPGGGEEAGPAGPGVAGVVTLVLLTVT